VSLCGPLSMTRKNVATCGVAAADGQPVMYVANVSESGFRTIKLLAAVERRARVRGRWLWLFVRPLRLRLRSWMKVIGLSFWRSWGRRSRAEPGSSAVRIPCLGLLTYFTAGP